MTSILLLEDDPTLAKEIDKFLSHLDYKCHCVADGHSMKKLCQTKNYDLIILDINVPGLNGLEVCKQIREENKNVSILMLTAFGEVDDKLTAFSNGADDYLVKPFHFEEFLARIKSLLRRNTLQTSQKNIVVLGDLVIDTDQMRVTRNAQEINLSPKEFRLLAILAKAHGRVLSKNQIANELWDYHIETSPNTIEVYINFLRKKIDKDFETKLIHTKVGFGYYLK